jgi:hypothetical protein
MREKIQYFGVSYELQFWEVFDTVDLPLSTPLPGGHLSVKDTNFHSILPH